VFFSFSPFGYHFGSSYFHIFSQEKASTQLHATPSTLSPSSTPHQPAAFHELQHRHHPFPTTNHMSSTELHNTARHHPFPTTTNQPDVFHRAATPPPSFPDNHPAVFHRAATSPPSFPETTTQLSSTELQHRHHPFPRRPASCAFHRAATSPSSFPETTSQLSSTELQHRHHPFPTTTLPVLAAVCVSSLASCCCSSSSSSTAFYFFNLTHLSLGIVREPEVKMLPRLFCTPAVWSSFVVSLFLFSTLLQIHTILSTAVMSTGVRRICCLFVARGSFLFEVACQCFFSAKELRSIKAQVPLPLRLTRVQNLRGSRILAKWAPPSFNSPPCKLKMLALAFFLAFACWFDAKKAPPDPKEVLLKNRKVRNAVGIWGALYGIPLSKRTHSPCFFFETSVLLNAR
jgi:hypothetical protein